VVKRLASERKGRGLENRNTAGIGRQTVIPSKPEAFARLTAGQLPPPMADDIQKLEWERATMQAAKKVAKWRSNGRH
jgi:hypothetical protein